MKKFVSSVVVLSLFGCAADSSYPSYRGSAKSFVSEPQPPTLRSQSVQAPRKILVASQGCVDRHTSKLSADTYAILFEIKASEEGRGNSVNVKDSMVAGTDLETCLTHALKQMDVASLAINTQQNVTPQSRSTVGVVQAAAAPIAMLPMVLVAGGVTILVGVTIYVATEAEKRGSAVNRLKRAASQTVPMASFRRGNPTECLITIA